MSSCVLRILRTYVTSDNTFSYRIRNIAVRENIVFYFIDYYYKVSPLTSVFYQYMIICISLNQMNIRIKMLTNFAIFSIYRYMLQSINILTDIVLLYRVIDKIYLI